MYRQKSRKAQVPVVTTGWLVTYRRLEDNRSNKLRHKSVAPVHPSTLRARAAPTWTRSKQVWLEMSVMFELDDGKQVAIGQGGSTGETRK